MNQIILYCGVLKILEFKILLNKMTIYQIEIIKDSGNKRLIKRIFTQEGNKEPRIDYCIQSKIYVSGYERWANEYYNNSKTKVERRFLGI